MTDNRQPCAGTLKIQERLREIAIEILRCPGCAHELAVAYLISRIDVAVEAGMLPEFALYAGRFPDWLQQGADVDAGVSWPEEIEDSEARGR